MEVSEIGIIEQLASKGIKLVSKATGYVFAVSLRGEYNEASPEILLNEEELATMLKLGRIVGIKYEQKEKEIRVTV